MQRALAQPCKRPAKMALCSPLVGLIACVALGWSALPRPMAAQALPQTAPQISAARYIEPTDAYGHGAVAGGEYSALEIIWSTGARQVLRASGGIFEDTHPRLADLDGDNRPELVTVVADFTAGARIQVYAQPDATQPHAQPVAATAPIGQRHRWLAIAGIADLDGDGRVEIAYVDRPHLARVLRVVRAYPAAGGTGWQLAEIAQQQGHSNHQLRAPQIEGGLRHCGGLPQIITADAAWRQILATRLGRDGRLRSRSLGPYEGPASMARALRCPGPEQDSPSAARP